MTDGLLTAIILTKNEELHITRCIESVRGCASRVVVVDSYSSDRTVELAQSAGAEVFQRAFRHQADQFNWALDNCKVSSAWTMRIDADEYVDPQLSSEISRSINMAPAAFTGLTVTRYLTFSGRVIRHGGVSPQQQLRIWRTGTGRIENRWMDEHAVLSHGEIGSVPGALIDDNKKDVSSWVDKHDRYATREMIDFLNAEYRFFLEDDTMASAAEAKSKRIKKQTLYNKAPLLYRAVALFLYRYIFRLGFLDGSEGLSFNLFQTLWYRYLVDLKIIEARKLIADHGVEEFKRTLKQRHGFEL
ncbi:glycosyltransferase family 2 protein [Bradyrhizobium guangzhouense]|uniref:Glycosyltransferase family 2 protein n=1 Tax=Bradyrhizobium guangzhouense TaxID=1325095 RepID=A0AAE5X4W2_9BRAD|nr:glycosyltransferase family 2 protein [Bradyrhizobium guangzhouense]QAU48738.1 glycosyltransferase family 2 protein [Bradyrhizobium guangzhouense]